MQVHHCSRSIWFHALTEVAGKQQISLTKVQEAVFPLLLFLNFLEAPQTTKQIKALFPHPLRETLNCVPRPVLPWSNMGISHIPHSLQAF